MTVRHILASVFVFSATHSPAYSDPQDSIHAKKAKAVEAAQAQDYGHLITQHARTGKQPDPKLFRQWILDEINNESAMRDQIGDEIAAIEENGRNSGSLTSYYTRDKEYRQCLRFSEGDLAIHPVEGRDGLYVYRAVLRARDGFRGGYSIISFQFAFRAKVEFLTFTKAYQVEVVGYPTFQRKDEKSFSNPRR